jgi:hypothetical protein
VTGRHASGAVLVVVLLASLAIWLLLAGVLLITRLQFEVAVAARDHAVAQALAEQLIEARRAASSWPPEPAEAGEIGRCTWSLALLGHDETSVRYEARVHYGRAQVVLDGTVHR